MAPRSCLICQSKLILRSDALGYYGCGTDKIPGRASHMIAARVYKIAVLVSGIENIGFFVVSKNLFHSALVLVMSAGLICFSSPVLAEEGAGGQHFDLASDAHIVQVQNAHLAGDSTNSIVMGNVAHDIVAGDHVTPAQFVALTQVLNGGTQSLILDTAGRAVSGAFALNNLPQGLLSGLVIPSGVSAVHDFAVNATLSFSGNLVNSGNLFAVSSSGATTTAVIAASNIFNNHNAFLTTGLPAG